MATEYVLKLKAALDTTEVQQELKKLRDIQKQTSSANSTGAKGSGIGANIANVVDRLNQTLQRLTVSVDRLEQAERTRNINSNKPVQMMHYNGAPSTLPGAVQLGMRGNSIQGGLNGVGTATAKYYDKLVKDLADSLTDKDDSSQMLFDAMTGRGSKTGALPSVVGQITGSTAAFKQAFGDMSYGEFTAFMKSPEGKQWLNPTKPKPTLEDTINSKMISGFGHLIGGQILTSAGNDIFNYGLANHDASKAQFGAILQGAGTGLTQGASAAMIINSMRFKPESFMGKYGSSIAAGIGGVAGVVEAISSVKKFNDAIVNATDRVSEFGKSLVQKGNAQAREIRLRAEEKELVKYRAIATAGKRKDDATKTMLSLVDDLNDKRLEVATLTKRLDKAKREYSHHDATEVFDSSYWAEYVQTVGEQLEDATKELEKLQKEWDDAAAAQERYRRIAQKIKDLNERDKAAKEAKDAAEQAEVDANNKLRQQLLDKNYSDIAGFRLTTGMNMQQIFANDILSDKTTGANEKFTALAAKLDEYRSLKKIALQNAYSTAAEIDKNSTAMTAEQIAATQNRQAAYEKQASDYTGFISIFENALQQISTHQTAPDISHVTTLGQYGFNMGEKDDTVERMNKYYSKSLNLQEQIKNKLEEGVKTEATYQ